MLALWAFCPALSSAWGSKYTGLSKDSVSGSFMLLESHVTALRQHRIPLRKGWEYVKKYLFVSPHCLLVPYPSWKNVAPFSVFPFTQKRDRRFPRISGIVSVSFAVYWTLALTTTETRLCGLLVCTRVLILPSVRGLACALPCPICDETVSMPRNRFSSCKFRSV